MHNFPKSLADVLAALGVNADAMAEKFAEFRTGSVTVDEALDKLREWYAAEVGEAARSGIVWEAAFTEAEQVLREGGGETNPHHGGIA